MSEKTKIYKDLAKDCVPELERKENIVRYNGRCVYIVQKRVLLAPNGRSRILSDDEKPSPDECNIAYAYLGRDIAVQSPETSKACDRAQKYGYTGEDIHEIRVNGGLFVICSSRPLKKEEVLGKYYTRQQIEQVFDICKNNTKMLPLRTQTEETFRGHLIFAFIASVIVRMLQEKLKNTSITPEGALFTLRNQKCKVFDNKVITCELVKKSNDVLSFFKLKCPVEIPIKG